MTRLAADGVGRAVARGLATGVKLLYPASNGHQGAPSTASRNLL
jgi:hypothetical protein